MRWYLDQNRSKDKSNSLKRLESEMPTSQQHSRVNLVELKAQIIKKIGVQRTDKYFGHLDKLFSQKLAKVEFDKLCYLTLGKENIGLHNQLIWSILKNAYQSHVLESLRVPSKSTNGVLRKPNSSLIGNGDCLPSLRRSNEDTYGRSSHKTGSRVRDRKVQKRLTSTFPRPVNSHRDDSSASRGVRADLSEPCLNQAISVKTGTLPSVTKALANDDLKTHDLSRPLQLSPASSTAELPEAEALTQSKSKRPRLEIAASPEQVSAHEGGVEAVDAGNEEVAKEVDSSIDNRLSAPLGVSFRSGPSGYVRRPPCSSLLSYGRLAKEQGCLDSSQLPSTECLHRWMEQVAKSTGLQAVSEDSANVLSNGLDAFLKRLIESCVHLKGRPGQKSEMFYRQIPCTLSQERVSVNLGNSQWMPNACIATDAAHIESCPPPLTFLDFKTAMELNPQQLGGHRSLWMEKIGFRIL